MKPKRNTFLSPGQQKVLEALRPILKLATCGIRSSLPLKMQTASLIVGKSGTGKSHAVRELAMEAGVPFWEANVASWIVLGARNGNTTLSSLVKWIVNNKNGVIFLDELDKLTSTNEWTNSIRLEIHDIIDGRIADGAIDVSGTTQLEEMTEDNDKFIRKSLIKFDFEDKLKNSFLVVGAGAWQSSWSEREQQIGFHNDPAVRERIDRRQILKSITPEILQRFRSEILFLDPMTESDYLAVLTAEILRLPEELRLTYATLVVREIRSAVDNGLGMRIFEEVYTQLCVEEIRRSGDNQEAAMRRLTGL
jgi:ATP-dependent Clp protease ATP-binding subunit ClpA